MDNIRRKCLFSKKDLVNLEGLFMLYAVKTCEGKVMAAKNMNTSIDTLNKYLDILERELGLPLIALNDRRCGLTTYGDKLFIIAEQMIDCLRKAYVLKEQENSVSGEVKVACDRMIAYNLGEGNLGGFLDKYANISLSVDALNVISDWNKRDYDLGISYDFPKDDNLVILTSKNIVCGFFATKEYLEQHERPNSLADILQKHRLILKREWLNEQNALKQNGDKTQGICLSNSNFVVNEMVSAGGGIGILPKSFAIQNKKLVCLDKIDCPFISKAYLFTRKDIKDVPKIRAVINYYKQVLEAM